MAHGQKLYVYNNQSTRITLHGSTSNNHSICFQIKTKPSRGKLTDIDGKDAVIYKPDRNFVGQDSFTFMVTNGIAESEPAIVYLQVVAHD